MNTFASTKVYNLTSQYVRYRKCAVII